MGDRDHTSENKPQHRRHFTCPVCKRRVSMSQEDPSRLPKFFPFCSERCKLIDLGAWLDAEYRIPSKPDEESEASPADDPAADEGRPRK